MRKTKLIMVATFCIGFALVSGACGKKNAPGGNPGTELQKTPFDLNAAGVKNFRALYASMGVVTGVAHTPQITRNGATATNPVVGVFNTNLSRLSINGDASAVSSASLLATALLAGSHCDEAIKNHQAGQTSPMFASLNFGQNETQLTAEKRKTFITDVLSTAWPGYAVTDATIQDFSTAIDGVIAGGPANSTATLRAVALVVCSGALGSLPFYSH